MPYEKNIREYEQNRIPAEGSPRHNEAWALIEVARRMAAVIQFGDLEKKEDKERLREAMRLNLRIWTFIQAEQSVGENLLPLEIRQNILTLCGFIDKHTMGNLAKPSADKVATLININRNIASGLLGNPDDETPMEAPAETEEDQLMSEVQDPIVPTKIEA